MSQLKEKLHQLQETIPISDVSLAPVRDMLGSAAVAVNGAPDKLQAVSDTIGCMAFALGTLAIREGGCPLRVSGSGRLAAFYPFRWPACVLASVVVLVLGGERVYNLIAERAKLASCVQVELGK